MKPTLNGFLDASINSNMTFATNKLDVFRSVIESVAVSVMSFTFFATTYFAWFQLWIHLKRSMPSTGRLDIITLPRWAILTDRLFSARRLAIVFPPSLIMSATSIALAGISDVFALARIWLIPLDPLRYFHDSLIAYPQSTVKGNCP